MGDWVIVFGQERLKTSELLALVRSIFFFVSMLIPLQLPSTRARRGRSQGFPSTI